MDGPSDPKKRKVHTPNNPCGDATLRTLDDINAVLEEHARQIQTLVAANRSLDAKYRARVDELEAECREKCESLERECGILETRCRSLERSIKVLKKDVSWSYSAPDIPRSHWIERGHEEEYADNLEGCLRRIKGDAAGMRTEGEQLCCDCLDNEDGPTISHDDALLPHLKELADAIQVSDGIRQIVINNIELHPSALSILFPAMEGKVTGIDMRRMRFPGPDVLECYESIATSIGRNHALENLVWLNNQFPSDEQADLVIESIINNETIKDVHMGNCFNQNGLNSCRALASLLRSGRPFEKIGFNDTGLSGMDDVAAALATNPQLQTLCINHNTSMTGMRN